LNNYPAWRFSTEGQSVIVCSPEEDSMLDESWGTIVPEGFDPKEHPTYPNVELVPLDVDVEAIAAAIGDAPVRRKPGRKPKVQ
jgi:hypothetical protein